MASRNISPQIRWLVELMDQRFTVPGTRFRFGYDALVGLLPGIGDFLGSVAGLLVVLEALRLRLGLAVIARMLFNLWIDGLLGSVPVLGDLWDFYFKAHRRNLKLLEAHL